MNYKLIALILCYGAVYDIKSNFHIKSKTIVTHKSWQQKPHIDMEQVTDAIMDLCKKDQITPHLDR